MIRVNDKWDVPWQEGMTVDDVLQACDFTHHYVVVSINGAGFDFRVLAAECQHPEIETDLKRLALAHYDPCFQMLCQRGFRVGLDALARGFGLGGKTEGMDGSKAASDWFGAREDQERVLEYCEQDALLTLDVALNMESASVMRW